MSSLPIKPVARPPLPSPHDQADSRSASRPLVSRTKKEREGGRKKEEKKHTKTQQKQPKRNTSPLYIPQTLDERLDALVCVHIVSVGVSQNVGSRWIFLPLPCYGLHSILTCLPTLESAQWFVVRIFNDIPELAGLLLRLPFPSLICA